VQGDFLGLPFADARFDTVLLHQVLHFTAEPERALAEAARVLKSDGRIAIVDFAAHTREELRERYQHLRLGFADRQMRELLQQAGFTPAKPVSLEGGELVVKVWLGTRVTQTIPSPRKEPAR
jgi:ArsR family transcriptional regulator